VDTIPWQDSYNTGIRVIDDDHRMLFDILNGLIEEVNGTAAEREIGSIIQALRGYVDTHFAREEGFLEKSDYPDLKNHKAMHEKLRAKIYGIEKLYLSDPENLDLAAVCEFLSEWLIHHILNTDMVYVPYLKSGSEEKGLEEVTLKVPHEAVTSLKTLAGELAASPNLHRSLKRFLDHHFKTKDTLYEANTEKFVRKKD